MWVAELGLNGRKKAQKAQKGVLDGNPLLLIWERLAAATDGGTELGLNGRKKAQKRKKGL